MRTDAIEAQIVAGTWKPPREGESVGLRDGVERRWEAVEAGAEGWLSHRSLNGGWAYWRVDSHSERVMLLDAAGHAMVYVNGEPRMGDVYSSGTVRLAVLLKAGANHFLFSAGRGRLRAKLESPQKPVFLESRDQTLPDALRGESGTLWAGVVLVNATTSPVSGLTVMTSSGRALVDRIPTLPPLSARKIGIRLQVDARGEDAERKREARLMNGRRVVDTLPIAIRVRRPGETFKRTFVSGIDGSVQYYAVRPPAASRDSGGPALVLSLHGAAVEATGQADAYSGKPDAAIVCPTNRRPYGFDWEDWGRLDAMEVLEDAKRYLRADERRIYLTGHSMGGHGTWHLGATFPDRWGAIGPSAGWISFWTYAGGARFSDPAPVEKMLLRAANPSDTLALARNLANHGVYILHGDSDDNVPVTEARAMKARLAEFHTDLHYHEQPGAGHWWDSSDEPGAECVDWPPLFELFARRRIPQAESVRRVQFATMNPGISSRCYWAEIESQIHALEPASIDIRLEPLTRRFIGTTRNVQSLRLRVDFLGPSGAVTARLDGDAVELTFGAVKDGWIRLERAGGRWSAGEPPRPARKGPHRYGPFKEAFQHRFALVYGTAGTPEENAWAYAKARFDAETWCYRGNGSVDVIPDSEIGRIEKDRSVLLYGNAETNSAWKQLLGDSPVQVTRSGVQIGGRNLTGSDLSCLFLRPRPGSDVACVGVISGTGIQGMRLTDRMPYFVSGVAYPDCTVLDSSSLTRGTKGVLAAGFFGTDWGVETGDWAWRDAGDSAWADQTEGVFAGESRR